MARDASRFGRRRFAASVLAATSVLPSVVDADDDLITRLSNGAILRDPRRDAHPLGRATGLVDAPVSEVMHVLLDFSRYAELLSLREVALRERTYGRALLSAEGRFFGVGSFAVDLDVRISGTEDGKHQVIGRRKEGTLERLDASFFLERSPGGARSVLRVEFGIDAPGILPNRLVAEKCTDGAVVAVARVRRFVREARALAAT